MTNSIKRIQNMLNGMRLRPEMYFKEGLQYDVVHTYLDGFMAAESIYGTEEILRNFEEWIYKKRKFKTRCGGITLQDLIWEFSGKDNQKAVEMLFKYLDQYLIFVKNTRKNKLI
jgi:hypothetical protein